MDRTTGSPTWSVVAHDAGVLARAVETLNSGWHDTSLDRQQAAREMLESVTAIGTRLARVLDSLATQYEIPGVPEQHAVHIALDQAAAAAEDLGACARRAVQTLQEQPEDSQAWNTGAES